MRHLSPQLPEATGYEGQHVSKGEVIAEFGMRFENGNWPPHLHFN